MFTLGLVAQDTVYLEILNDKKDKEIFPKKIELPDVFLSKTEREMFTQKLLFNLYDQGFLLASYQILNDENDSLFITFDKGKKIQFLSLHIHEKDLPIIKASGIKLKEIVGEPYHSEEVSEMMRELISYAENHGYPFASAALDSIQLIDSSLSAYLNFNLNRAIFFDSIRVLGNLQLSNNFLQQYSGIQKNDLYNQELINDLDERLQELAFVQLSQGSSVEFSGDRATILVYLNEKNSSRFNLLIGVLPNNEITGRLIVTGEGLLHLQNLFNAGELIDVQFSKLELSTKSIQAAFTYPYLPSLPIGLDFGFDLFLRDSSFIERKTKGGLLYQFIGNNYLKAFSSYYQSNILSIDTATILALKKLPASLDVSVLSYGLEFNFEKLNYAFNPKNGFSTNISFSAGTKKIKENNAIASLIDPFYPEFDFGSLYDSIAKQTLDIKYNYQIKYFQPLARQLTMLFAFNGASVFNEQIFANELYRIGGNHLLRGFDDQSVLVSDYHIFTAELRYLLGLNSFASLFFDQALVQNKSLEIPSKDFPFGLGAGVNFETKAGIFGVSYALGSQNKNPLEFKNAKIHFGYVNYF